MSSSGINAYQASAHDSSELDIERYGPIVKRIAYYMSARLPDSVQLDDLIQAGMLGLLEAASNFDASKGASFETFASIRIRGAMIDEVRRGDWTPRSVHRHARSVTQAIHQLSARLSREPTDIEIANEMSVSLEEYYAIIKDASIGQLSSLEDTFVDTEPEDQSVFGHHGDTPEKASQHQAFKNALIGAIDSLPEREQLVVALYYNEELNLKEIGQVIEVGESRVSQILSQATLRLRAKLEQWQE